MTGEICVNVEGSLNSRTSSDLISKKRKGFVCDDTDPTGNHKQYDGG